MCFLLSLLIILKSLKHFSVFPFDNWFVRMAEESKDQDPLRDLLQSTVSFDHDFKVSLDEADVVLGPAGTTLRMCQAAPRVGISDMEGLIFFNKSRHTRRLQIWQMVDYHVASR